MLKNTKQNSTEIPKVRHFQCSEIQNFPQPQQSNCQIFFIFLFFNGLLGRAISCGPTYVRLGDHRPHVGRKASVEGGVGGEGG